MSSVCSDPRYPLPVEMVVLALCPVPSVQQTSAIVQSPLARRALPLHHSDYGLMCGSFDHPSISLLAYRNGPCRLGHPRLVRKGLPSFIPLLFPEVLRPLPRVCIECICPFLPRHHRPRYFPTGLGSFPKPPQTAHAVKPFRGGRHFVMLRRSSLFALLTVPTVLVLCPEQRRGLYPQSFPRVCYRPLSLINYPTETGQLLGQDFHLLDQRLAGCRRKLVFGRRGQNSTVGRKDQVEFRTWTGEAGRGERTASG